MMLYVFIRGLTGRVFKILPLKEAEDRGEEIYLNEYLGSLARDMYGATMTFPELQEMQGYVTSLNVIEFLLNNEFTQDICKKEVFKILGLLNAIEKQLGGEPRE